MVKTKNLDFKTAFYYPFHRAKGMWNILWLLFPIFGWFALGGYSIRIVKEFLKGKFKELPEFNFKSDLKLGFFMFLKGLPFFIGYEIIIFTIIKSFELIQIPSYISNIISGVLGVIILPILIINFFKKETVQSLFEFSVIKYVFNNFRDYVIIILYSILLAIVFLVMCLILVGIPASTFTKNIFIADFYRRHVK